jgi:hypothetical protein
MGSESVQNLLGGKPLDFDRNKECRDLFFRCGSASHFGEAFYERSMEVLGVIKLG